MNRSEIRTTLEALGLRPNKKLGQNFLCSDAVLERILSVAGINSADWVLEIGPGLGVLTSALASRAGRVTAVEIDSGLYRYLGERFAGTAVELHHDDFLKARPEDGFTKSVSNLPYYCATEIIFRLAESYGMAEVYVMLQKEMAERITASPGTKNYGALSVTMNFYFSPEILFDIDRSRFYPEPEVKSSFLRLSRKPVSLDARALALFHALVKSAFWGRRKPLSSSLARSPHLELGRERAMRACAAAGIDCALRGERLGLEDYLRLARILGEDEGPAVLAGE